MMENIINEDEDIINDNNIREDIKVDKDKSFSQLLSLQLLIQKHSGLKRLCKYSFLNYLFLFFI